MVEFSLPKNSKVGVGRTYREPKGAKNVRSFRVYRWNPDDKSNPKTDVYEVSMDNCGPMLLDVLVKIKNEIDSTVAIKRKIIMKETIN